MTYIVNIPQDIDNKSYTIWYKHGDTTLPLLAGLEQKNTVQGSEAKLGLVFLQGKRFAECNYNNNELQCTLDKSIQSRSMQYVADSSALIIAHTLNNKNPLPQNWHVFSTTNNNYHYINTVNNDQLRIEEN